MATPGGAEGQRRGQATAVGEPAGREHRDLHGIEHLRQENGRRDRARVAATLATLHDQHVGAELGGFLCVAQRADRGDADEPGRS